MHREQVQYCWLRREHLSFDRRAGWAGSFGESLEHDAYGFCVGPHDRGRPMTAQLERDVRSDPAFVERVQRSHSATRTTIRLVLLFVLGAAAAAPFAPSPWLPVHLLLAGGAALAISAVTVMLTVTWSAAPAPPERIVAIQRACIALGAAGVVATREIDAFPDWSTGIPGALYLVGLVLLAGLLLDTSRKGQERRFDVAVAFYVSALVAAVGGVGAGIAMATSGVTLQLRSIHVVANLLGFIGLTMAGSLPFFAATVGRSRMAPAATPKRLAVLLAAMVLSIGVTVGGLLSESDGLAFSGLGAYLYCVVAVYCFMPRPTKRQLTWAGPRLVALWCAGIWWLAALGGTAYELIADERVPFLGRWTHVLVVGAYAQILWGSLAYLIPMLRGGGPEKLSEGFDRMRSWIGFAGLNAAAIALALDEPTLGIAFLGVTVVDGLWRTVQVGLRQLTRPAQRPRGGAGAPDRSSGGRSVEPGRA